MWCTFVNDPTASPLRVAFAIGRSVGSATQRNRLRRRLRALISVAAPQAGIAAGWLLVGGKPAAVELTFEKLGREVDALMSTLATRSGAGA